MAKRTSLGSSSEDSAKRRKQEISLPIADRTGSQWTTEKELDHFNVVFQLSSYESMFSETERNSELSPISRLLLDSHQTFISDSLHNIMKKLPPETQSFWVLLDHITKCSYESVDDFVSKAFWMLLVEDPSRFVVNSRPEWPLHVSGMKHKAVPDLYVRDFERNETVLIVQEDKSEENRHDDPFAQVLAEAIASFQLEQSKRKSSDQPQLASYRLLLGVCHGSIFYFLRVHMPASLPEAVRLGQKHQTKLVVQRSAPLNLHNKKEFELFISGIRCWKFIIENPQPDDLVRL